MAHLYNIQPRSRGSSRRTLKSSDFYRPHSAPERSLTLDAAKTWVESCGGTIATIKKSQIPPPAPPI
jgi:hypothetical protein